MSKSYGLWFVTVRYTNGSEQIALCDTQENVARVLSNMTMTDPALTDGK
jgi:hypothetical protein